MTPIKYPQLCFDREFDERTAYETEARGCWWLSHIEFSDGRKMPVTFYDPVRLVQDLEVDTKNGNPYIIDRGLILLNAVTRENMEAAIKRLGDEDFFSCETYSEEAGTGHSSMRLCFDQAFDEQAAVESKASGYWKHSHIEVSNDIRLSVTFCDPVRLAQDLQENTKQGRPFATEHGLIVLDEVTRENMQAAIKGVAEWGKNWWQPL